MNVAGEFGIAGLEPETVGQVYVVIVNEDFGDCDEGDVPCEPPIVKPVDADRWNAIDKSSGVNGHDDKVGSGLQNGSDFAVEWREAAFVIADPLLVDPDVRPVVSCTDVKECAGTGFGPSVEVSLIPNDALVVEELWLLGIPVAGNFEGGSGREIELFVVLADDVGVIVHGVGLVVDPAVSIIKSPAGRLVNKIMPVSVETGDGTVVETDDKGLKWLLAKRWEHQR